MEKIKYGYNENINYDKEVNKVRAIVLNKQGKALLVKYAGLYMLPGGKIDGEETEIEALKREILEESGIEIDSDNVEKFLEIEAYDENYYDRKENKNINRITNTSFYIVNTNKDIDNDNKELTESEIQENHTIEFTNLSLIEYLVQTNKTENKKKDAFDREILTALREYKKYITKQKETGERE